MFEPFRKTGDPLVDYPQLIKMHKALLEGESNEITCYANSAALINWFLDDINWVGYYLLAEGSDTLELGPFQGLPACTRIPIKRGVCGKAVRDRESQCIADVNAFPGHIACDGASRSELVIPLIQGDRVLGVLDIDSPSLERFTAQDQNFFEELCSTFNFD